MPKFANFPGLDDTNSTITSPATQRYNCIAWAADETVRWWWPTHPYYWPPGAPREETVAAFAAAFASLGFSRCADGTLEFGFIKIGLYIDAQGKPKHMARQLTDGSWTSKLGGGVDIRHTTVEALDGSMYGRCSIFFRRPQVR